MTNEFTITKKIAKHGNQAVIVVPKLLQNQLSPGTIAEIKIQVLEESEEERKEYSKRENRKVKGGKRK